MRKTALSLALVCAALAAAALPAAAAGPSANAAKTKKVKIGDEFFKSKNITIKSGDKVKWVWVGSEDHDVVVTSGPRKFHSRTQSSGSYSKTLRKRGTYRYLCSVHPDVMRGKVVVK
ncbi:MAG TPA: plastocyanin/azurin family copper-binding protein [Thermoleophilaceae bacterium]